MLCTDLNCTDLECIDCFVKFKALTDGLGLQPIQPQLKRARTNHYEADAGQGESSFSSGLFSHPELQSEATVACARKDLKGLADHVEHGPKRPHTQHDHTVQ